MSLLIHTGLTCRFLCAFLGSVRFFCDSFGTEIVIPYDFLNFGIYFRILEQVLLRILPALSDLLTLICIPCAGLDYDVCI